VPHFTARVAAQATLLGALALAAAAAGASAPTSFVGPPPPPMVRYDHGRVTVIADNEPLSRILDHLGDAAAIEVRGALPADPPLTVRIEDVSLRVAVERLLRDCNFTLRFAADGTPRRLTLRGAPAQRQSPARASTKSAQKRAAQKRTFFRRWAQHPPVHVDGALAAALGMQQVRLPQLARAVGTQRDPTVRRQIMQHILRTIEGDSTLRAGLRDMTAQDLAHFARSNARTNAPELTAYLSRRARDPTVRSRARAAMASLH
jgi:hypothetical protein